MELSNYGRGAQAITQAVFLVFGFITRYLKRGIGKSKIGSRYKKVAKSLAPQLREQLQSKDLKEHIRQVAGLLQKLGYQAHTESAPSKPGLPILTTHNCVYHDLATNPPEVCAFDIALLEQLVNRKVDY